MKVEKLRGELVAFDTEEKTVEMVHLGEYEMECSPQKQKEEFIHKFPFEDEKLIPFFRKALDEEAIFVIQDGIIVAVRFPRE